MMLGILAIPCLLFMLEDAVSLSKQVSMPMFWTLIVSVLVFAVYQYTTQYRPAYQEVQSYSAKNQINPMCRAWVALAPLILSFGASQGLLGVIGMSVIGYAVSFSMMLMAVLAYTCQFNLGQGSSPDERLFIHLIQCLNSIESHPEPRVPTGSSVNSVPAGDNRSVVMAS